MIVALAGGIGGAKLALGLSRTLDAERLAVIVNTGDDFVHLGLHISPDIDTVIYTLAGLANRSLGWGLEGETWSFMQALERLGGETWFRLGDRDLATHIDRTRRLAAGESLSVVTAHLSRRLGIGPAIIPITDNPLRTIVETDQGTLGFQDYFVRLRCDPHVVSLFYEGATQADPAPALWSLMNAPNLEGVIICPSNPYLSVGPIIAVPAIRSWLERRSFPVVAVSPIIAGDAVKGPAAKILRELNKDVSPVTVAEYYAGLIDVLLIDEADAGHAPSIAAFGIRPEISQIFMRDLEDRDRLARECISHFACS